MALLSTSAFANAADHAADRLNDRGVDPFAAWRRMQEREAKAKERVEQTTQVATSTEGEE